MRTTTFSWRQPLSCNPLDKASLKLLTEKNFSPCGRCLRGQYFNNVTGFCSEYCPDGTYSLIERNPRFGANWNVEPSECPKCPEGKASVKYYELEHFQTFPDDF